MNDDDNENDEDNALFLFVLRTGVRRKNLLLLMSLDAAVKPNEHLDPDKGVMMMMMMMKMMVLRLEVWNV